MNDKNSLSHTSWNCKYHIVFAPKYRRKIFYQEKREDIRNILRTLCEWKGIEIIEGAVCPDPYTIAFKYPTPNECCEFYGISERKKQFNDIPEIQEYEICLLKS